MHQINVSLNNEQYSIYINDIENKKSFSSERHSNALFELHIAVEGTASLYVEDKELLLLEGDCVLVLPGQYHCFKNYSEDFYHFALTFASPKEKEFSTGIMKINDFGLSVCKQIFHEAEGSNLFKSESIDILYKLLFVEMMKKRLKVTENSRGKDNIGMDKRLGIIDNFFENCFYEDACENTLAQMVNLSRRQLGRVLKTHYDQTFREKLMSARMDFAAWLLKTTDCSVSEIGRRTGYESETAFLRTFKKYYGVTPTIYRKN